MVDTEASQVVEGPSGAFRSFDEVVPPYVLCLKYNDPGDKLAVALSDHRIRVYSKSSSNKPEWKLFDQWRGHDAEIFDASHTTLCLHYSQHAFYSS